MPNYTKYPRVDLIFKTERLTFRQFDLSDTDFIIELVNSEGWIKFIGERNIKTTEAATAYLQNGPIKSYEDNGYGLSMVILTATNEPIGMCGILKRANLDHPDIGFAFLDQFMGKGYAFEIASAVLSYAKETLNIDTILAITDPVNVSSIRLLEKIGLHFEKIFTFPDGTEKLMLFKT